MTKKRSATALINDLKRKTRKKYSSLKELVAELLLENKLTKKNLNGED